MKKFTKLLYSLCIINLFSPPKTKSVGLSSEVSAQSRLINTMPIYSSSDSPEELLRKTSVVLENLCEAFLAQPYPLWDYRIYGGMKDCAECAGSFAKDCPDEDKELNICELITSKNYTELKQNYMRRIIMIILRCVDWSKCSIDEVNRTGIPIKLHNKGKNICTSYNKSLAHIQKLIPNIRCLSNQLKFDTHFRQFVIRFIREYTLVLHHEDSADFFQFPWLLELNQPDLIVMNDLLLEKAVEFFPQETDESIGEYLLNSFLKQKDSSLLERFAELRWGRQIVKGFVKHCMNNEVLKNQHSAPVLDMEGIDLTERRIIFYLLEEYFVRFIRLYNILCPNKLLLKIVSDLSKLSNKKLEGALSALVPKIRDIHETGEIKRNPDEIFSKYENMNNFAELNLNNFNIDICYLQKIDLHRYLMLLEHIRAKSKNDKIRNYINSSLFSSYSFLCDQRLLSLDLEGSLSLITFLIRLEFDPESIDMSKSNKLEQALFHRKKGNIDQYRVLVNECLSLGDLDAANFEVAYSNIPIILKSKLLSAKYKVILFNINDFNLQSQDIARIKRVLMLPENTEFFKDNDIKNEKNITIEDIDLDTDLEQEENSHALVKNKNVKNKVNDDDSSDDSSISAQDTDQAQYKKRDSDNDSDHVINDAIDQTVNDSDDECHLLNEDINQGYSVALDTLQTDQNIANERRVVSDKQVTEGTSDKKLLSAADRAGVKIEHSKGRRQKNNLIIKYTHNGEKKQYLTHWHGPLDENVRKLLIGLINNRPSLSDNFDFTV